MSFSFSKQYYKSFMRVLYRVIHIVLLTVLFIFINFGKISIASALMIFITGLLADIAITLYIKQRTIVIRL
jgi:hypothetical protein